MVCDLGRILLLKKNAPTLSIITKNANGRMMRNSDIPAAFIAVNSNFSARFPNEMSELSKIAKGKAKGTTDAAA